ncbi:GNAT family protein [Solibacillus sp. FSL R7-0682]|uniref:GNAT family N-acetyltransferase n=1 Tax=Solibacillus sp. FSL R7-0682 TaxID=2921690 RepID=UPI0030F8E51A
MYKDNEITIRPMQDVDLPRVWELEFKDENPEWKKWNAPYFPYQSKSYEEFLPTGQQWVCSDNNWIIEVDGIVCGIVSYYWEHEPSKWLEMGICLHQSNSWGKGIGTRVLKLWIQHLFTTLPIVRVGFTTWSGNERMIAVGQKLGMQLEARIRRVRLYEGNYYDSIWMGILREEWEHEYKKIHSNQI